MSDISDLAPLATCNEWRTDSPLAVGLASKIGDQASSLLAPHWVHCNKELVVLCIESTSPSSVYARKKRSVRDSVGEELSPEEYRDILDQIDQDTG